MQESNPELQGIELNSDSDQSSEISGIPQLQKINTSITEERQKITGQYIKVENRSEKIDEEGILQFLKKQKIEISQSKKAATKVLKRTKTKTLATPSKKQDLNNTRRKWKAQMDSYIAKYKEYLKEQKTALEGKQKQYLLEFYKVLLDGIYELKELNQDSHNDLTSNEKKIIAPEADFHRYLKDLVEKFNKAIREAKFSGKIFHIKMKWDPLIKNCKDETNLQLRRKIIRSKIKPEHVIAQGDDFLLSQEAKLEQERRRKLILNEAEKNFDNPLEGSEQGEMEIESNPQIQEVPQQLDSFKSISSVDNVERRILQQREKIEDYKQFVGDEPLHRVKKRINELLGNTSSYYRIISDFQQKFQNI